MARPIARARSPLSWLAMANLALLLALPVAWTAPLARAGLLPFFEGKAVSVLSGLEDLWEADWLLAVLVALFAIVMPTAKTAALAAVHLGWLRRAALPMIELLGKLSMAEVFLLALYIVIVKGTGLGHVAPAWGLWLFTACVLAQMAISHLTARILARDARDAERPIGD
ncbi:MAG: paraquat-inducible protein A [Pseudomonadota bacterium]